MGQERFLGQEPSELSLQVYEQLCQRKGTFQGQQVDRHREEKKRKSHVGEWMQAGLAAMEKAQLCPWKAQGMAQGEGRAPSHQVPENEVGVTSEQVLWGLWDPLSQT